jgi:hypothetical protein
MKCCCLLFCACLKFFKKRVPISLQALVNFQNWQNMHVILFYFLFLKFLESTYGVYKCLWVLQIGKTCEYVDDKSIHVILFFVNVCIALFICVEFHRILAGVSIVVHHYVLGSTCTL